MAVKCGPPVPLLWLLTDVCGCFQEQLWREHRIVARVSPALIIQDHKGRDMRSPLRLNFHAV